MFAIIRHTNLLKIQHPFNPLRALQDAIRAPWLQALTRNTRDSHLYTHSTQVSRSFQIYRLQLPVPHRMRMTARTRSFQPAFQKHDLLWDILLHWLQLQIPILRIGMIWPHFLALVIHFIDDNVLHCRQEHYQALPLKPGSRQSSLLTSE